MGHVEVENINFVQTQEGSTVNHDKNRWVYELRFDPGTDIGMLSRPGSTSDADPSKSVLFQGSQATFTDRSDATVPTLHAKRMDVMKAHQDLLGTLYRVAPAFKHTCFEEAKASILTLAHFAHLYGCEHIVKLPIENHLRFYRNEVLDLCASDPVAMLELSTEIKSEWVFMEAATNLLGRSNRLYNAAKEKLAELKIEELLNKKRKEFEEKLKTIEHQLFRIAPAREGEDHLSIASIAYFRQELQTHLKYQKGSGLSPGYANLYHDIATRKFSNLSNLQL